MKKIIVKLENCYGIPYLMYEFDFSKQHTFSIYSPNGVMKTSFAKTFDDIVKKEETKDKIFTERDTIRSIFKDNVEIEPENILVIKPYEKNNFKDNSARLLVSNKLKREYDNISKDINTKKEQLLKKLEQLSGLPILEIELEISKVFQQNVEDKFFDALQDVKRRVEKEIYAFDKIRYKSVFSQNSLEFLASHEVQKKLQDYFVKYEKLLDDSIYFKKGIFNHTQADTIATSLEKNGFFNADHSVLLSGDSQPIDNKKELSRIIQKEKDDILKDPTLKESFESIDKLLTKNKELKDFRSYLLEHDYIISELKNYESFKAKLWIGYLQQANSIYTELLTIYKIAQLDLEKIVEAAKAERTDWLTVLEIFRERFFVPFDLEVKNKADVLLSNELPVISFKFKDRGETKTIKENELEDLLSQGEKRALYILNIIFKMEQRKKENIETVFIIDDIADSFDYKNKYAIIQYLKDISEENNFYQIVLTHNFDFYRTLSSRLYLDTENRLYAIRTQNKIILSEEKYSHSPFTQWQENLDDPKKLIAAIPLIRNIAELLNKKEIYNELTSFLHVKTMTATLTIGELKNIFSDILPSEYTNKIKEEDALFLNLLKETANSIIAVGEEIMGLEDKIVLSVAIRIRTEEFLYRKLSISPPDKTTRTKTGTLFKKYKNGNFKNEAEYKSLERVSLMTPENIHLNSFAYEPLIDMSGEYLSSLYQEIDKMAP